MDRTLLLKELLFKYTPERITQCITKLKENPMDISSAKTVLYYYFLNERLNTKIMNTNFYEFYDNFDTIITLSRPYILNVFNKMNYKRNAQGIYRIYRLYYGSCSPFKISTAYSLIQKYAFDKNIILDPCAGFGGRCIATLLHNKKYIGFDINDRLEHSYNSLLSHFNNNNYNIQFVDCLNVDYSTIKYDCVFTSPPYYNTELYNNTEKRSKKEWNIWYRTVFTTIYNNLMDNGIMILSINQQMYNKVFNLIFGDAIEIIPMELNKRNSIYKEYVYIWRK